MRPIFRWLILLPCLTLWPLAQAMAWNAAGHRLVAAIAWRQMSPEARQTAGQLLAQHPDWAKWTARSKAEAADYQAFLEAAPWADSLRNDPRFYDEGEESPTPPLPGLSDTARHKHWHYVDVDGEGHRAEGEIDLQIERLSRLLKSPGQAPASRTHALAWLIHLVGDIHQPLHVGRHEDEGGNRVEIEDPFTSRRPFTNLHSWWDDLPGPPWLRGPRLEAEADRLLAGQPKPRQGNPGQWREESGRLARDAAYPTERGSLTPVVSADFRQEARAIADRRLSEAGYRLGHLLNRLLGAVSRETE